MQERWDAVDAFIEGELVGQDDALREAAGGIAVSPAQGKLLHLLARSIGARRVLELGTLYGYSAIWLARALPDDGELITLEVDSGNAARARANVDRAGVGAKVDIRVGPAAETVAGVDGPFDLVFLDADKAGMPDYFIAVLPLTRPGGLIIGDNTVRDGAVADADDDHPSVVGARRFHAVVGAEPTVDATGIQTVGVKGYDGFVLALKIE
jgi:predicted O-methyltransferase YrrM